MNESDDQSRGAPPKLFGSKLRKSQTRAAKGSVGLTEDRRPRRVKDPDLAAQSDLQTSLVPARPADPAVGDWWQLRQVQMGDVSVEPDAREGTETDAAFDLLRTRFLRVLKANGWVRIAITAPSHGCGTTFCAVRLAQSLGKIPGSRIVLMDLNGHNPGVAGALGLQATSGMDPFLGGNMPMADHIIRLGSTLAVGVSDGSGSVGADRLHDPKCRAVLNDMYQRLQPDVVLYDLPPMLQFDDLEASLPNVDAVLVVADATRTRPQEIDDCMQRLVGKAPVAGVILNRGRGLET